MLEFLGTFWTEVLAAIGGFGVLVFVVGNAGILATRSRWPMAADWLARDYAAFLTLCRLVYEQAVRNDDEPVLNWYEQAYAAAAQFSPTQVRENLMQTCSSERSSQ